MARAAVLIGVNRTGNLPKLSDAVDGAKRMEQWALAQGMARHRVLLFTDESGPLDGADIRRAIRKLVDSGSIEQLIVYFAGHGVNIRYGEYWLLSDAPEDASAAVNVEGSMVLARRCGIPHVTFISDACRTAAEGVQAQGITGIEIFPNDPVAGPESPVDIFFGTTLGRPALEIKDPAASSTAFKAIYTTALIDAVSGKLPGALSRTTLDGRETHVVRPRPLKACLLAELPQRLAALHLSTGVSQIPDARITSEDDAWLANLDQVVSTPPTTRGSGRRSPAEEPSTPQTRARERLRTVLSGGTTHSEQVVGAIARRTRGARPSSLPVATQVVQGAHFETGCGFKVLGAAIAEGVAADARVAVIAADPTLAGVDAPDAAANVLLRLTDGSGVLLPAVRGFVTLVTVDDGEVVDVAYEPSENTPRWPVFAAHAAALRELRTVVAEAARDNALRLDVAMVEMLFSRMQYDGHLDPSLAVYAAYAFDELRMGERIRGLAQTLLADTGIVFFDIELLSRTLPTVATSTVPPRLPPVPMLARGWALLSACGVALPDVLAGIQRQLRPSLWTHFDRDGTDRLRELILTRRLQ